MRIGIIGGGIAGLGSAWLLEGQHEVTLFERQAHLGGHARTIELRADGADTLVETGFEFFSSKLWPTFTRLLNALEVEVTEYACRIGVHRKGAARARPLQAMHVDGSFAPAMLTPRRMLDLTEMGVLLASVTPLMKARDTSVTFQQALSRVPLTASFRDEFLFPFLLSSWCVEPDEMREFSAYNALRYAYMSMSMRGAIAMREVKGGMRAYVAALLRQIPSTTLRQPADIASITRHDAGFRVRERDGRTHEFDQLIMATSARDAAVLLRDVRGTERTRELLERFGYVRTKIGVHGDRSFMPPDERDWSIVNARHDGRYSHMTVWKPWRAARVFRSWLTFEPELPKELYELVEINHPKPTLGYFETQRALAAEQGRGGVWLAGMHMHDIDSHESALLSGVRVVEKLAPEAPRLQTLQGLSVGP